jgi:predicted RNase H-like nuclease
MQPAYTARRDMFGAGAPVWSFLSGFGGAADPLVPQDRCAVLETYPVLAMIALGWLREDSRPGGRLPKYNPARRKTFCTEDWRFVCDHAATSLRRLGVTGIADWISRKRDLARPRKVDQDQLDACLCLLVAVHLAGGREGLMVGNHATGYIVVPQSAVLADELARRCKATSRVACDWVRTFRLG